MAGRLAIIGFGEAGSGFAGAAGSRFPGAAGWGTDAAVFDRAPVDMTGVSGCATAAEAVAGAAIILCLVTADQAIAAAQSAAAHLAPGALWCDMNSVAPDTKRAAAAAITAAGGRYVDVAIMAPVHPALLDVPLLLAGPDAVAADAALAGLGFSRRRIVGDAVGDASAVKMLRSVIIKGTEALTAECFAGAARAGLVDAVLAALGGDWAVTADYNLDRMLVHGARRASEMDEVVATLAGLGIDPGMSRATAQWQRRAARGQAPAGLGAKLAVLA